MSRLTVAGLAAVMAMAMACADTVDPSHEVVWLSSVTDGVYNDPANWTGGVVPADGADGHYGVIDFRAADITVRAPAGGLTENSGTIFLGAGEGTHTLTIDTRGTFWEKKGVKSVNDWWCTPFAVNLTGSHVFNFEGCAKNVENSDPVWTFTDALFTWKSTGTSMQVFDLRTGTFAFAKPLYVGSVGGSVQFNIHPEARIDATRELQQRGNATTHTTFLGGRHRLNGIRLKDANSGGGSTWLHVTNDAVVVSAGGLFLGDRAAINAPGRDGLSTGLLDLSCTARMEVTNDVNVGAGDLSRYNLRNEGFLTVRDDATFYSHDKTVLGYSQASTGTVTLLGRAVFATGGSVYLGNNSNAVGRLEMSGDAAFHARGVLRPGSGLNGTGTVLLRDRARLDVGLVTGNWLSLGTGSGTSCGRFEATDDTVTQLGNGASIEMTLGGDARAEVVLSGNAELRGGSNTCVTNKSETVGNTSITLSGDARLLVRGVYGAAPVSGEPCMSLVGDGGTLAPNGNATAAVPFLSGCVGRLTSRGLTVETKGFGLAIDQDFTAAEGAADAVFVKKGTGDLTVWRSSDHPRTRVEKGALVFGAGVTRFGRKLELGAGATLALTDATAAIAADEISFTGGLAIRLPADYALDEAHPVLSLETALTDEQLAQVVVANPVEGRVYAFSRSADGRALSVTVSAATTGTRTWAGGDGSWNTAANWTPAGVPTHNDTAVVDGAAAISLDGAGSVGTLRTPAAAVSVTGADALQVGAGLSVAAGGALTLATPVRSADGASVRKDGSGTLVLAADNTGTMAGDWKLERGVTEFASAAALGCDSDRAGALALSNCTFRYTGEAATVRRPWRLDGEFPAVFDVAGDLTFDDFRISFGQGDNGIVKTGAGTLTLDFPAGTTTISTWTEAPRKGNADPSGHFAPSNGEVNSWDGLGQLSVLEGRLVIRGRGKSATTVKQEHHGALGGGNVPATARPELYLKDVTMIQGSGNGFHLQVDQQVRAGCPASSLVLDNADLTCNGVNFGYNKVNGNADEIHPTLAITNGTLNIAWNMSIPADVAGISPVVRVGAGGCLRRVSYTVAGGVTFTQKVDARFEDGGMIEVGAPQNLYFGGSANGVLVFARGGGMKVNRFLALNTNASTPAELVFDGGFAEFTLDGGISTVNSASAAYFRAEAGGGELIVAEGRTHHLAIPLRGEGAFTKAGAGTLVLTNDLGCSMSDNQPVYTERGTTTVKVANAGGIRVAAGTLVCAAGTTDASARFSGTGTLAGAFGASFTLDVPKGAADGLTLADVRVDTIFVDFGYTDDAPAPTGASVVVAKVPEAETFGAISWRARGLGEGKVATFARTAATGVVTATFKSSGLAIYFR